MGDSIIMFHTEENKNKNNFRFTQLQDLEKDINWGKLVELILPHYQSANIGRLLVPIESMIRVYFLQKRYSMSASAVEDALFQINVLRKFALINLETDVVPNEACIESFYSLVSLNDLEIEINRAFNIVPIKSVNSNDGP
jgi:IS5 family transposase